MCDVACGVVVCVESFAALLTAELVAVTVVLVGEATLCVTAPLTGVGWIHRFDGDTLCLRFVITPDFVAAEQLDAGSKNVSRRTATTPAGRLVSQSIRITSRIARKRDA